MSTDNDTKPAAEPAPAEQARITTEASPPPNIRRKRGGMRFIRYGVIGLVAIAAVVFGAREVISRMTHVYEYDARVVTDHVTISSRVDGVLRDLKVDTGDKVTAGAALAQMDDRVPALELRALQAELAALQTERSQYIARSSMVTQQTDSRYKTRLTSIRAERARRGALVAELRLARQEYKRFKSLFDKRVIARSRLDRAESEVSRLASDVRRADAEIASSRGEAQEAQADKAELSVIEQEAALVDFKEAMLRARIARHEALLSYRTIQTPKAGVIDTWVEANIKETQVRRLKVGQRVAIDVDAYPDDKFIGRVAKIGGAATSSFALLPTPNPSGNFTKVTQRIPVKITFEQRPRPLAPGMMVEVEIDTREGG